MPLHINPADFFALLPKKGALVALDVSPNNIGIAISDVERTLASPHSTLKRVKFTHDAQMILKLCAAEKIAGIIVGLPLNMDDTLGPRAQSCRSFALNLSRLCEIPITLMDERLSTAHAHDMLDELQANKNKRAQNLDTLAAQEILRRAMNSDMH